MSDKGLCHVCGENEITGTANNSKYCDECREYNKKLHNSKNLRNQKKARGEAKLKKPINKKWTERGNISSNSTNSVIEAGAYYG